MLIDSNKLKRVTNFADEKGLTRQHVYRLIDNGELNSIKIDGIQFVILDEKAEKYHRKRAKK